MPEPNVYEIRFVGDATSLTAEAEKAKIAVEELGQTAARQASPGLRGLADTTHQVRIGFRDASSMARIFISSLAQEMNPSVAAAISQTRMLSFSLMNLRQVLSGPVIAGLALAAGGIQFYTDRMSRLADIQAKATLAFKEFSTKQLVTDIRAANLEIDSLTRNMEARMTKFAGLGAIGGGVAGFLFGGPAGAAVGVAAGGVGGAALAKLLTGFSIEELRQAIKAYDQALGLLVPFERRIADAMAAAATAQQTAARIQIGLQNRRLLGMSEDVTGTFQDIQAETERRQAAELLLIKAQYQRESAVAAKSGRNAELVVDQEFYAKETEMLQRHQTELKQLALQYGQELRNAVMLRAAEQAAELADEIRTLAVPELLKDLRQQFTQGAGDVGAFTNQIENLQDKLRELEEGGAHPDQVRRILIAIEQIRRRTALTGPAEQVSGRPGEMGGPLPGFPLIEEGSIPDIVARGRRVGLEVGEAQAQAIIEGMRIGADEEARIKFYEDFLRAPLLKAADNLERDRALQLRVAEALAKINSPGSGIQLGILRMRQQAGTFEENMAQMMEGIGSAMSRGLEDTFFSVVTGQFKGLVDVARQVGYAIVREMTRMTAQMAVRGLFGEQGGTGGLFGSLLSMLRLLGGGGGVAGAVPEILRGQHGGIFTKPTLTMIAEAGEAEAVIPLSKLGKQGGGGVTVINLSDRDQLAAIVAQEMSRGREVIVNDVVQGLRGNSALRRGVRRFT